MFIFFKTCGRNPINEWKAGDEFFADIEVAWVVDLLGVWLDHDVAVDEDCADDGEGEHGVGEDVDGDSPDRMKWRQQEERLFRRKTEDCAALKTE